MARLPNDHPVLIDLVDSKDIYDVLLQLARDLYFLESLLIALADLEDDPSEAEEEDDPEEVEDPEDECILQDDQEEIDDDSPVEDKEGLNDEEPSHPTLPSSTHSPFYQPYRFHGKSPLLMRTPRMHVHPVYHLETFTYVSRQTRPISGQKRKPTFSHELAWLTNLINKRKDTDDPPWFEIGKYSHALPHVPLRDDP